MNSYENSEKLSSIGNPKREFSPVADGAVGLVWVAVPTGYRNPLYLGCANRVRGRIDASGLLRKDVAMLASLGHPTISRLEDGLRIPRLSTIERLGDALGVAPTWLAYGEEGVIRFRHRRPRSPVPFDAPEPDPARRPVRDLWRGIGPRLRRARLRLGFALRDIADAAGISPQGVLLIERGESDPMISTVEQIAVALDVAPGWLAFGEGEGPEHSLAGERRS